MSVTQALAQFIVNGTYNDLPEAAVVAAKRGILDFIAVTLAGSREPVAQKVQDYARQTNCSDQATVMNGKFKTSACLAAPSFRSHSAGGACCRRDEGPFRTGSDSGLLPGDRDICKDEPVLRRYAV